MKATRYQNLYSIFLYYSPYKHRAKHYCVEPISIMLLYMLKTVYVSLHCTRLLILEPKMDQKEIVEMNHIYRN